MVWMSRLTSPSISSRDGHPVGILFYRAHWMSGNLLPIDALIRSLEAKGRQRAAGIRL